jgi:two-component system chemotaxis response regulator CheY
MRPTILIVDDSATMRALVRQALKAQACTVIEAPDGVAALAALERTHADLVITDLLMPEMDGLALTRSLRADARFAKIPILVLTTETAVGVKERGRDAGATGWLCKPFHPDTLRETVQRVLAEHA